MTSIRFQVFWTLLLLVCTLPALAAPAVVVVLLPGTSLAGWQSANSPTLHRLMQTGAIAVMNTRTAHQAGRTERETPEAALLTLGAGARAAGPAVPTGFLPASSLMPGLAVSAGALFERRTGGKPPAGSCVCPDWPAVLVASRNAGYDLRPGNLADALAAHGVSVAAGGGRDADWLAAGSSGTVQHVQRLQAHAGECLIWDAGPDLHAADAVLASAAAQVAALQGRLFVLSPLVRTGQRTSLAPVLFWGPDVPAGLISSPSTRRPGLTTNTDFAPAVAAECGIPRTQFQILPFGFAWSVLPAPNAVSQAARLSTEAMRQSSGMRLLPYLAAVLGVWILVVTLLASRLKVPAALYLAPAAALIAALFAWSLSAFVIILPGLLIGLILGTRFCSAGGVLTVGSAALALTLCADMVTGNTLMHRGLLGYSALEGARYYGIGNEAMGLLLGAALVAVSGFRQKGRQQLVLVCFMLGIIVLLGSAGAKAGGVLVSLSVFGAFLFAASGRRWTPRSIAMLTVGAGSGIALAALGDAYLRHGSHSHIGEAVERIASGGLGEAGDIVRRKLAVEGRLAYHSAWAALLWLGGGCAAWRWNKSPPANKRDSALHSAGMVGIAACLLLNDAGVVAASIFGVFLWSVAMAQKSPPALEVSSAGGFS